MARLTADPVQSIPTGALRAELQRREQAERDEQERQRKASEVRVYCPACDGGGRTRNYGLAVGVGEQDEYSPCGLCRGDRIITARLVR